MARRISGQVSAAWLAAAVVCLAATPEQAATEHISADSLKGHLSFLASDLLEGRATPSRGLDLAAEYIAAQFRRAGLEPAGDDGYFQTATLDAPAQGTARNVAGILRGSDPELRETYVVLSAHYDHIGMRQNGDDKIYNGANDDASGTASVIEIASALASMPVHPKRSILFLTFYGEERGLWGSRYYAAHPLVPLEKTVAALNLEQLGRSDATNGPQVGRASLTGFDDSDLPKILADAAQDVDFTIYKDPDASERYFERSDNLAFARAGVPAHTLYVALDFADYHRASDEWNKIDYPNLTRVDRAIAVGILRLASDAPPPQWNASNPAAQPYIDAAKKLRAP